MPATVFGPSLRPIAPEPGGWLVTTPGSPWTSGQAYAARDEAIDPLVEWCRNASAVLKREKQDVTEAMTRAINIYRGGAPWWRQRPRWKLGSRFNYCMTIPIQWASILSDNRPRVIYSAHRPQDQAIADIATAAFTQAWEKGGWQRKLRNAILGSRIQKKYFLRLTFDPMAEGGSGEPQLTVVSGEQVFVDANATCMDDAEVVMFEYRESPNKIFARWPHLKNKIIRKRSEQYGYENEDTGSILSPPTTMQMPTGAVVNNPPYGANANPPDNAGGTSGIIVREFWTRPRKTLKVKKVLFAANGEPAMRTKMCNFADGTSEPLKRVVTEGNVIYEWPESYIAAVEMNQEIGGLKILDVMECLEPIMHTVEYPWYPDGRLVIVVDDDFKAEDRMNPLGYFPFVEIEAYPDPAGFWGSSDVDIIADAYEYYIRLLTMMYDAANLTSNPIWRLPLGSEMAAEDITNAPGAVQFEDMASLRYGKREPGPDMPQYVMNLLTYTKGEIRELSGLNEIASGQAKFKGQQSAETVSMYQEAAGVRFNDALHGIERAMVTLGGQFLKMMVRNYTTTRIVQIKVAQDIPQAIPYLGSYFVVPLKIEAKPGSSRTPTARFNMIMNLLNSGKPLVDMVEVWEALQELNVVSSASALEQRIKKFLSDPSTQWLVTGMLPGMMPSKSTPKKTGSKRAAKAPMA